MEEVYSSKTLVGLTVHQSTKHITSEKNISFAFTTMIVSIFT